MLLTQIILNGIVTFSHLLLVALSFFIIYSTTRFFHFAHAVVFTSGAYIAYIFKIWLGWPFYFALPCAILFCGLLGCLLEIAIYEPLRRKKASSLILLLASLGIYIFLQNTISMIFGDETKSIRSGIVQEGLNVFGARITPIQIATIITCIIIVLLVANWLNRSKIGKATRAVANDLELANISGIDSNKVILFTFAIGSALAGIAGILFALDVDMTPTMGLNALLMGVVVVIIGGVGSIPGIVLGALLLGMALHLGAWFISTQWQDAIAFIILLIFLLYRPEGFFGANVKKKAKI